MSSNNPKQNNKTIQLSMELAKFWSDPDFRSINAEYNELINALNFAKKEVIAIEIQFCPDNIANREIAIINKKVRQLTERANKLNSQLTNLIHQPVVLLDIDRPDMDLNLFLHQVRHMADTLTSSHNTVQILLATLDNNQKYYFALKYGIAGTVIVIVSIAITLIIFFIS